MSRVFHCPECGAEITVHWARSGEQVACLTCGAKVSVPALGEDYPAPPVAAPEPSTESGRSPQPGDGEAGPPVAPHEEPYELYRPVGRLSSPYPLRPMNLPELLDRAFIIFRRHFWLLTGIVAVGQVVPFLLLSVGHVIGGEQATFNLIGGVVSIAAYVFSQVASTHAVSAILLGETITINEAYRRARGRGGALLGTLVLMGLGIFGSALLFIIPGIVVALRWSVAVPAVAIEFKDPVESLRRSWNLTSGFAGRMFLCGLLVSILSVAFSMLFTMPFMIITFTHVADVAHNPALLVLQQLGVAMSNVLVAPLTNATWCLVYYDLRIRKEGFDVEQMIRSLGPSAGAAAAPPVA